VSDDFVIRELKPGELDEMMAEHKRLNPDLPVRDDVKEHLDAYAYYGKPLGGFLTAVVTNDLFEAMGKADSYNRASLYQICHYIYNELPADCWGSPAKMRAHLNRFKSKQQLEEEGAPDVQTE